MVNHVKLLIIENHPMVVKGYLATLESINKQVKLFINIVNSCDDAYREITKPQDTPYTMVLLGIHSVEEHLNTNVNTFDLGKRIRKQFPKLKILVTSILDSNYSILKILKDLIPNGFLVNQEITPEKTRLAFITILEGQNYFSNTVKCKMKANRTNMMCIDAIDMKILYYLKAGEKMKNLPQYIPLSLPSIERRKKRLKQKLNISDGGDQQLLKAAKLQGVI